MKLKNGHTKECCEAFERYAIQQKAFAEKYPYLCEACEGWGVSSWVEYDEVLHETCRVCEDNQETVSTCSLCGQIKDENGRLCNCPIDGMLQLPECLCFLIPNLGAFNK